jgi:diguanylate cyclase (GGDEF)-like protein/PAS domain S-box-containing protein
MKNWWQSLGIGIKLNIPIQVMLVFALSFAHFWIMGHVKENILDGAQRRAMVSADGIINGMNMLMVTGMISIPENRRLFISKMGASENVKELRIIRAKQVQDQFGPGLPEEQAKDELDKQAILSKQPQFLLKEDPNLPTLRTVVPFIVSTNFRGTNCLMCHHVEVGSVNGAASIILDLTEEFSAIKRTRIALLFGQAVLQILLFFSIHFLIRRFMSPVIKLQSTMESMQRRGSMEQFVPIELDKGGLDEIGKLTVAFNQMAEALGNSEKSMKLSTSIYQTNADGIIVTDESNLIVDVNPAFTNITGYTLNEVIGKNPRILQSGHHDEEFYRKMWQAIQNDGYWQGEIWDKRKDGGIFVKLAYINVLRRSDGSVYRYVEQFSDITEKKQKDDLIYWQANYDQLTSLPNRRLLNDRLGQTIASNKRNGRYGALLFIDLDKFKTINDTLGHEYGDKLLVDVAKRLKLCVRDVDSVARLGGDEFVVLLESLSVDTENASQEAAQIAEKMRASLASPYLLDQIECHTSPSIGVYLFSGNNEESAEEIIKRADIAMYQAKDSGRNTVRFFDPFMQQSVEIRASLEADLRRAIPEKQFQLFYQIQLDTNLRPFGAEALIRWKHPKRGMVLPAQFIPFSEESSLILEIGNWVLDTSCQQIAAWSNHELTRNLELAINISAKQFKQPDFVNQVTAMIRKHHIEPSRLKLELTESVALENVDLVVAKMNELRNVLGVTLSLDDFGTGYSSLSNLKRLPIHQVKIDKSFIRDIASDASDVVMIKTIIDMSKNFGLSVIAEGVETEAQLTFLKENGCMAFQGYLFSNPVPIEQFDALLKLRYLM